MGTLAAVVGAIGGLCAVIGIVITAGVTMPLGEQFTWGFWFALSAILLLASIAFSVGKGGSYE